MNRVQHILHAFSMEQIKSLYDCLLAKDICLGKLGETLSSEDRYALELLEKAIKS